MKIGDITITLKCLFCGASLQGAEDAEYYSGDLIRCPQCCEENDFDSVLDVAKQKGGEQLKKEVAKQLAQEMKRIFEKC